MAKHRNKGLQKICGCARTKWSTCAHAWHFSYQWKGTHWRLSLDKELGRHLDSKSEAETARDDLKKAIKLGTFRKPTPKTDLTVRQLADEYLERYVTVHKPARKGVFTQALEVICRTEIKHLTSDKPIAFGEWPVADVVSDSIERFREVRRPGPGTNRYLAYLRALWTWGLGANHVTMTPFRRNGVVVVKLDKILEHARSRRLDDGEEAKLVAASGPSLQALILAAIETGMRRGEILSLQWEQVEGMTIEKDTVTWAPRASIFLPRAKTKTKKDRRIPISSRLRGILEMRRFDPAGHPHAGDAYVFGTEIGSRVLGFKRAWATAVLKAHGQKPTFTDTANLAPASRAALEKIDLHFHDLRREAGSRWMDAGTPLATIQRWLGHSNISQTSTYLSGTATTDDEAMRRFEGARKILVTVAGKRGQRRPRTAVRRHGKRNKTGGHREQTIN